MSSTAQTTPTPGWSDRLRAARRRSIRVADHVHHRESGEAFAFDDTYEHEVRNDTGEQRVVLIFHANRPMRRAGDTVNRIFQGAIRRSAYVQDPMRNLAGWADRFDSAIRRASGKKD